MIDFVQEFVIFLLQTVLAYTLIQLVMHGLAIWFMNKEIEQHVESKTIPITVEFDNNQYYCYNKNNNAFMAQGSDFDEIRRRLQARFANCVVYIDGGDPAVIDQLMKQR
jgi:hypothetical protein